MAGLAIALSLLPLALSPSSGLGPPSADDAVHTARATKWLARNGREATETAPIETILREDFVTADIGMFQVLVSASHLTNESDLDEIKSALEALLQLQSEWVAWLPGGPREDVSIGDAQALIKTLSTWVKGWKAKRMDPAQTTLLDASSAKDKQRAASEEFASYMRSGGPLVVREQPFPPTRIVFIPERRDFVEFIAVTGLLELRHRPFFWKDGTEFWTEFDFDGVRVISSDHATLDSTRDYTSSTSMAERNPTGVEQHVTQLAMRSLLETCFGARMESMLAGGIASDMVIAIYNEVDTRTDGDLRARSAEGRSAFVPNGNPNGGALPPADANSRWREQKGKDYFVGALRRAQKAASKKVDDDWKKEVSFLLFNDSQSQSVVFSAPFLGPGATMTPDEAFRGDYAEFVRAYRACFLYWVRTLGAGSKSDSREHYAAMLRMIAEARGSLADVFENVYGVPISAPSGEALFDKPLSLEAGFLAWLSKQR